jgi:signal transduction histidine kinase/HAMP domain-containing protein
VALLAGLSLYTIVRNNIHANWQYLDRIANLIQTDILSAQETDAGYIAALAGDDYIKTKIHVHAKYGSYLSSSTLEWDMVPLREYLKTFALENHIEILAIYELHQRDYQLACSFGNTSFLPLEYRSRSFVPTKTYSSYSRSIDFISVTSTGPVTIDGKPSGLITIQKMYDSNFFRSYCLKYGVDVVVEVQGKTIFSSLPNQELGVVRTNLDSAESHMSLRLERGRFAVSQHIMSLGDGLEARFILTNTESGSISRGLHQSIKLILLAVFSIMFSVALLFVWGVKIIGSIQHVYRGTEEVSRGNLDYRLPVTDGDELGRVSENFNQMVSVIQDKNANLQNRNKELRIMNYYIDSVLQSLQVNTIVVDREYRINLINNSAQNILNIEGSLTRESLFSIAFFRDKKDFFQSRIDQVFRAREYDYVPELKLGPNSVCLHLCPIVEGKDEVFGVLIVLIDNTERELLKRELLRSQEVATVGQVYAYLAHEINNPVTVILNHIDLLKGRKLNKEEADSFLGRIEDETLRIHRLVRNLLQFIKGDQVEEALCDLSGICEQIITVLEPMMNDKAISVELRDATKGMRISGNLLMLKQLFLNLVKNAVEAVDASQGKIAISIEKDDGQAVVNITDNGRGIPTQELEKIFEPFYTSKSATNTGLGLSLCREIVVKHKGAITVESEEGQGTRVRISFPAVDRCE